MQNMYGIYYRNILFKNLKELSNTAFINQYGEVYDTGYLDNAIAGSEGDTLYMYGTAVYDYPNAIFVDSKVHIAYNEDESMLLLIDNETEEVLKTGLSKNDITVNNRVAHININSNGHVYIGLTPTNLVPFRGLIRIQSSTSKRIISILKIENFNRLRYEVVHMINK